MLSAHFHHPKPALGAALTLTLALSACGQPDQADMGDGSQAMPVQVQVLQPGTFEDSSDFVGSLEAEQRVDVRPEVAGRITRIFVSSGGAVSPGQPIVQLSPDQPQAQVSGAQAGAQAARFGRDAAQAQVAAAQAQLARAQADVELATTEFSRTERLVGAGALSRQDLDNARNQLSVAQASQTQAQDNVRAAQAQLQQATATFDQTQAEVTRSQGDLGFTQISTPIAGWVGDIPLRVGDFVEVGQAITTITQNQALLLRIQVPTSRSDQLRLGTPVELLDAKSGNPLATGSVSVISPEVDAAGQSILVKARFPNDAGNLRDGQFVRARMIWDTTAALLIPTVAVSRLAGQSFVFVAAEQTTDDGQTMTVASQRPVQLGAIQAGRYQVIDGLQAGDEIVVSNILQLQDGVPIVPEAEDSAAAL